MQCGVSHWIKNIDSRYKCVVCSQELILLIWCSDMLINSEIWNPQLQLSTPFPVTYIYYIYSIHIHIRVVYFSSKYHLVLSLESLNGSINRIGALNILVQVNANTIYEFHFWKRGMQMYYKTISRYQILSQERLKGKTCAITLVTK